MCRRGLSILSGETSGRGQEESGRKTSRRMALNAFRGVLQRKDRSRMGALRSDDRGSMAFVFFMI